MNTTGAQIKRVASMTAVSSNKLTLMNKLFSDFIRGFISNQKIIKLAIQKLAVYYYFITTS